MITQFLIIFIFLFVGDAASKLLGIAVPGTIIGMVLLFLCLMTGILKLDRIEKGTNVLLQNMALFFIPPGVSLVKSLHLLEGYWIKIGVIMLITTILTIGITGSVVQILIKRGKKDERITK